MHRLNHSSLSLPLLLALACQGLDPSSEPGASSDPPSVTSASGAQQSVASSSDGTAIAPNDSSSTSASSGGVASTGGTGSQSTAGTQGEPQGDPEGTGGSGGLPDQTPDPEIQDQELLDELTAVSDLDAAGFAKRTELTFETLGYDPSEAIGLDLIQASALGMTQEELAKFQENGFVISQSRVFPHFSYGYASIYLEDLPLFISADSILYALHTSYEAMLKSFEEYLLLPALADMLARMRANLSDSDLPARVRRDLDVYLSVADGLLAGAQLAPGDVANEEIVASIYQACVAAAGAQPISLFGSERELDFSQFTPRGHYTDTPALSRYFRAMMWFGRIDFRLLVPGSAGELELDRVQAEAALALRSLMDEGARQSHEKVDDLVSIFVGEHDSMTPQEIDELMSDLGVATFAELSGVSDAALEQAILDGGYGVQRISSHIMKGGLNGASTPLPASFALLGQRYVIDSHVFSNVVYDRVQLSGAQRLMPNPLDVAYAALQNDHAGMLLEPELQTYDYASDLASMRVLVDSEQPEYWELNLYNRWLGALRSLSPAQAWHGETGGTLPQIARTEAWGRRLLNTQLASWAELRHDTILYTKQSYTSAGTCEYPDAYVDPYPEFFEKVRGYAEHALGVLTEHGLVVDDNDPGLYDFSNIAAAAAKQAIFKAQGVLAKFIEVCTVLAEMAEYERTGAPFSEAHMQFVNQTVSIWSGCGPTSANGWYGELFIDGSVEWAPTIADVHTQPDDGLGNSVGRVLHVGTGEIRTLYTSVESCSGPRAYVGLVSSYYEHIESDYKRLNDIEWEQMLENAPPESPAWLTPLLLE